MKSKSIFFAGLLIFLFSIFSCKHIGIPSPFFAYVEVLDENDTFIENCEFSATYKGTVVENFMVMLFESSNESIDHINSFKGKKLYEIGAQIYSDELLNGKDNKDVLSKFSVTILKTGYNPYTFTPSLEANSDTNIVNKSVTLIPCSE